MLAPKGPCNIRALSMKAVLANVYRAVAYGKQVFRCLFERSRAADSKAPIESKWNRRCSRGLQRRNSITCNKG
jgi:hypothetical protein